MTYSAVARLLSGKRPFMLMQIKRGLEEALYCDQDRADLEFVIPGVVGSLWSASGFSIGNVPDTSVSARADLPITFPKSDEFVQSLQGGSSYDLIEVTIWHGYFNDPDSELVVLFAGEVLSVAPGDRGEVVLKCMTEMSALERRGLTTVVQRPCTRRLYRPGCNLKLADWQVEFELSSISEDGSVVEFYQPSSSSYEPNYFKAGVFEYSGRLLWIMDHVNQVIVLEAPATQLLGDVLAHASGDDPITIKLAPGCNLTTQLCLQRFNNLLNYGGLPHMGSNPFDGRSLV